MNQVIADDAPLLQDVWHRIQRIEDPCHALSGYPLSIADLGIVNRIEIVGADIEVGLTYTEMGCSFAHHIVARLEDELRALPGVQQVRVVYEPFPPWNPDRLSERARSVYADRKRRSVQGVSDARADQFVAVAAAGARGSLRAAGPVAAVSPNARRAVANADWNPDLLERLRDWFVVDGVVHLSNTLPNNVRQKRNTGAIDFSYSYHEKTTPARYRIPQAQFARSWQPEEGVDMWFLESPTAVAVYHSTPLYYQYWDGLNSNEKGAYLKANYPERVIWYGAVDLFEPLERVKAKIDELVAQDVDGLKFYPTRTDPETQEQSAWFMNDRRRALPAFEHARDRGIRHIAVHKLLEYTGPETPALAVEDMYDAAAALPDVHFEMVHAGWLLLEETAALMKKHENVVAVMEGPMMWLTYDLPAFHRMMAVFMNKIDVERMIYSSVATRQHPYWQLTGLLDYRPPDGATFTVTEQAKRKILGENAARLYGIDITARRRVLAADRFSRELALSGLREPYQAFRA